MKRLTFNLELRRMTVLPRILMLVARLGGVVRTVQAEDHSVALSIDTPLECAHRFAPQLQRIIEVLSVTEVTDQAPCGRQ